MTDKFETKLDFAKFLAVEAGNLARELYQTKDQNFVSTKGLQDFVTKADRKVEQRIQALIRENYPADAVLGEEEGQSGRGEATWVIDPIDGTANYIKGLPDWAVSIAYCKGNDILMGVIFAPDRGELCWAVKDEGAFCNGTAIKVSDCNRPEQAVLLLGRSSRRSLQAYLNIVQRTIEAKMEYRRNGSAAVSLMSVALGRAEGYYEAHLNAWDALAGILIIREAGGLVRASPVGDMVKHGSEVFAVVPGVEECSTSIING